MIIKLLICVLVLAFVSPVWAGSWGQGPGRRMNYGLGPCADLELDLSSEQSSRMKADTVRFSEEPPASPNGTSGQEDRFENV